MAVLVLVDSGLASVRSVPAGVYAILAHLGAPYRVRDLKSAPPALEELLDCRAVILAHAGVGASLGAEGGERLAKALRQGTGLMSVDPRSDLFPDALAGALGLTGAGRPFTAKRLKIDVGRDFLTRAREGADTVVLPGRVRVRPLSARGRVLALAGRGPAWVAGKVGAGRFVAFGFGSEAWEAAGCVHGGGMDDLFWRSLVWAARKPFVMNPLPPFVTARIDDCCGIGSVFRNLAHCRALGKPPLKEHVRIICSPRPERHTVAADFAYLDIVNQHGYVPMLGVFTEQVRDRDAERLARLCAEGRINVGAHAFAEYFNAAGHMVTEFIYQDTVEWVEGSGNRMDELTPRQMRRNLARRDGWYRRWGIPIPRTVNSHWRNPCRSAGPILLAKGEPYLMVGVRLGHIQTRTPGYDWRMAPYGRPGLMADFMPLGPERAGDRSSFFTVVSHPSLFFRPDGVVSAAGVDVFRPNPVIDDVPGMDLDRFAQNAARQLRHALNDRFFACVTFHEQSVVELNAGEFDSVLTEADRLTRRHEKIFASYDHIAAYARSRACTEWAELRVRAPGGPVSGVLRGEAEVELSLEIYADASCRVRRIAVGPFQGATRVRL